MSHSDTIPSPLLGLFEVAIVVTVTYIAFGVIIVDASFTTSFGIIPAVEMLFHKTLPILLLVSLTSIIEGILQNLIKSFRHLFNSLAYFSVFTAIIGLLSIYPNIFSRLFKIHLNWREYLVLVVAAALFLSLLYVNKLVVSWSSTGKDHLGQFHHLTMFPIEFFLAVVIYLHLGHTDPLVPAGMIALTTSRAFALISPFG